MLNIEEHSIARINRQCNEKGEVSGGRGGGGGEKTLTILRKTDQARRIHSSNERTDILSKGKSLKTFFF